MPATAVRVLTGPASFFRDMPKTGGYPEPFVFAVVMAAAGGAVQAVLGLAGLKMASGVEAGAASIIMMPVAVAIGGFLWAGILYLVWKFMGSAEPYETAYRCSAYALGAILPITAVFGVIPFAGVVLSVALSTYLLVTASSLVHGIPAVKAWIVFGVIGVLLILVGLSQEKVARDLVGSGALVANGQGR